MGESPPSAQHAAASSPAPQRTPGPAPIVRPYFIPASVDFENLPEEVRLALIGVVGPAYEDFVDRAKNALERAAGVTLAFALTMEVLEQFKLARVTDFSTLAPPDAVPESGKLLDSYLRLAYLKQKSAGFLFRLHRSRPDAATATLRRPPEWPKSP